MKHLVLLNKDIRYTHMPILNFFYLSFFHQNNDYFLYGIVISFLLLVIIRIAGQHHVRVARETGRTNFEEMVEDMYNDKIGGFVTFMIYLLFLGTFFIIATNEWIYPYTHILIVINLAALVSQLATAYYERDVLYRVFVKPKWEKATKK